MEVSKDFVDFLNESCTAFHAVDAARNRLLTAGFIELNEKEAWSIKPSTSYFFVRNGTTIVSFTVGSTIEAFAVIGAHTDSPCLKIKPIPCSKKSDALVLNTQPYGGGLWHTWFDRDLGIAGKVIYKTSDGVIKSQLVRVNDPVARIPNLAIHLTSGTEREHFAPNLQDHAKAILTMNIDQINANGTIKNTRFHPYLLNIISNATQLPVDTIIDMELQLIDIQPSSFGGYQNYEYILSGRLDNLCSSYQALRALIETQYIVHQKQYIAIAILFDHEEVGSSSTTGAGSSLFIDTLKLIHETFNPSPTADITTNTATTTATTATRSHGSFLRILRNSFVISADMAHGLHPNYTHKHDSNHAPKMNQGLVVKHNANQRYATTSHSATILREIAFLIGENIQEFSVKSDMGCGSTIGPIIATLSGITTVDVGSPQFSMHSIREMMGTADFISGYNIFKSFYTHYYDIHQRTHI